MEACTILTVSLLTEQASAACEQGADLWHQHLGHANRKYMADLSRKQMVTRLKLPSEPRLSFCEGCVEGKMHHLSFKSVGESPFKSKAPASTQRCMWTHGQINSWKTLLCLVYRRFF